MPEPTPNDWIKMGCTCTYDAGHMYISPGCSFHGIEEVVQPSEEITSNYPETHRLASEIKSLRDALVWVDDILREDGQLLDDDWLKYATKFKIMKRTPEYKFYWEEVTQHIRI